VRLDRGDAVDGVGVLDDALLGQPGTGRLGSFLEAVGETHAWAAYDVVTMTPMSSAVL
jgi:hypothetical protein